LGALKARRRACRRPPATRACRYARYAQWARTSGITLSLLDMARSDAFEAAMGSLSDLLARRLQQDDSYSLTLLQKRKATGEITSGCICL
jgi:hypothetical protein